MVDDLGGTLNSRSNRLSFLFLSQLSSLHQAQSLRRKKRRSVLSIFSGFRKNRNSTISTQESE